MFSQSVSPSSSLSFSPSLDTSRTSTKRKRQSSEAPPPAASVSTASEGGKPKPRRIDPDRLAIRLGPDLVAEMDKFLVPGAKMPSFAIRQELVKKYHVDRRHIYDYLHSRGLRVAKEDKHLNLSHRMQKKQPAAAPRKPLQANKNKNKNKNNMSPAPAQVPNSIAPTAKPAPPTTFTNPITKRKTMIAPPAPTLPISATSLPSFSLPMDLSSDSFSNEYDTSLTAASGFMDSSAYSSFEHDLELLSHGFSVSDDKLSEYFGPEFTTFNVTCDSPDDPLHELDELLESAQTSKETSASFRDSLEDLSSLSEQDRLELYDLISASVGPPRGVQECAGTYKAHMELLYSNRSYPTRPLHYAYNYGIPGAVVSKQLSVVQPRPQAKVGKENMDPSSRAIIDSQHHNSYTSSPRRDKPSPLHFVMPSDFPGTDEFSSNRHTALSHPTDQRPKTLVWTPPITSYSSQPQQQWNSQTEALTKPPGVAMFYSPTSEIIFPQPRAIKPKA